MGDLIRNHPKMVNRWAKIYITRYLRDGDEAELWALGFFDKDSIPLIAEEAKKEIKKRGLKLK